MNTKSEQSESKKTELAVVTEEQKQQRQKQERTIKSQENFLHALKQSAGMILASCEYAGISHQTYYRWCENDPEFKAKVDEILNTQLQFVRDKLTEQIHKGNIAGIIYYLKCKDPEFRPKVEVSQYKTVEDLLAELKSLPDDEEDDEEEGLETETNGNNQQEIDSNPVQDSEQTKTDSAIHSEHSPEVLDEAQKNEEHNSESKTEGDN